MKIILDDSNIKESLYPFTATRHVADLRIGILTIREKWQMLTSLPVETQTVAASPTDATATENDYVWPANVIPTRHWLDSNGLRAPSNFSGHNGSFDGFKVLTYPWHIFELNSWALQQDFELLTANRASAPVSSSNRLIGTHPIFLEPGAVMEHAIINTTAGPVYLGRSATVMEGAMIRGPFALGESGVVKMGCTIYGATTIGPFCTVGGEIKNSVMMGHSNKAHEGYLGDSVIGTWCNLGAGTTNSNLKNTAGEVRVWNNASGSYVPAGLKCGLLMGDYSRTAINTRFNTGSVVGTCCHVFGDFLPPKHLDNFTWGTERYTFAKAIHDIDNWKKLKGEQITSEEITSLQILYNQ